MYFRYVEGVQVFEYTFLVTAEDFFLKGVCLMAKDNVFAWCNYADLSMMFNRCTADQNLVEKRYMI